MSLLLCAGFGWSDRHATLHGNLEFAGAAADARERLLRRRGAYVRFAHDHPDQFVTMLRSQPDARPGRSRLLRVTAAHRHRRPRVRTHQLEPFAGTDRIWATLHGLAVLSRRRPHERFGLDEPPEDSPPAPCQHSWASRLRHRAGVPGVVQLPRPLPQLPCQR
ncbi:TetR-like C-terminal domain-containing protein [Streptacidiphilus sp. MAP12-16]|uniref:TetR-like C-terminal domain-containing protein n=1 Tax=Streptacidiphilus sp. MAP12-16 TaxID=3156300 RepID=UPI003517D314